MDIARARKHLYIYIYIYIYIYNIYIISDPQNTTVATHALGSMMYSYALLVPLNQRVLNKLSKVHNISGHGDNLEGLLFS